MEFLGENIAFIPVRGGSESIPLKNIKKLLGKPLVFWTIEAALESNIFDKVIVSTDHPKIKSLIAQSFDDVLIIHRSEDVSSGTASTESVMLEFANKYDFSSITLIQATSPLLTEEDLVKGFEIFKKKGVDSLLSVVRQKRFIWDHNKEIGYSPTNYDIHNRPRRQEQKGYLVENGAFYITNKKALIKSKSRISGFIDVYEMSEESYFEIDEPSDWIIVENLLKSRQTFNSGFSQIRAVFSDVDGVLTDSGMYYTHDGHAITKFNTRDGVGFEKLQKAGIITGIISGEDTPMNIKRFKKLGIEHVFLGIKDKLKTITHFAEKHQLKLNEIAYIGDDLNDLEVIQSVGLSACPKNAIEIIQNNVNIMLKAKGGKGVFREFSDLLLSNQDNEKPS